MDEYINRFDTYNTIKLLNRVGGCAAYDSDEVEDIIKSIPSADVTNVNEVIKCINFAINATTAKTDYDTGLRNGLRLALCYIEGKEPDFEECDSALSGTALLPVTPSELTHLINDVIAYTWGQEKKGNDKKEFGYFSRKELIKKLKKFKNENFPPLAECCVKNDDKRSEENE